MLGAAAVAVLAAGAVLLSRGAGAGRPAGASADSLALAVLPFQVRGGPDYAYLSAGLVDLLSTTLDDAAGLRTVDPRAALKAAGESPLDREAADAAARRAGAGLYVLGDVLEAGGRLQVSAALYRAGQVEPVTRASAQGRPEGLFELVDTLTVRLLTGWGEDDPRVSALAAHTTTSLPALKAYLDGEAALRDLRFGPGLEAYQRAVAADSGFALAWYRLSIAAEWLVRSDLAHDAAERAVRFAHRLPARDSLLLRAMLAGRLGDIEEAEPIYRRILAARPDDIEAWVQLGEMLFHYGPMRGRPADDSRQAWYRVAALEPGLVSPLMHLTRLAARAGRLGELDSLRLTLDAIRAGEPGAAEDRGDLLEVETLQAFTTGDVAAQDRALAELRLSTDLTVVLALWVTASFTDDLPGAMRIAEVLAAPGRSGPVRAVGEVLAGSIEMGRGRWREAQRRFSAADALHPPLGAQHAAYFALAPFRPRLDPRAATLVRALPDPARADTAPGLLDVASYFTIPYRAPAAIREYLRGLEAAARGDAGAALAAAGRVERFPSPIGSPGSGALAAGIRAELAWQAGNAEGAWAGLAEAPSQAWYIDAIASPFVSGERERWRVAEALERLGRPDEAAVWFNTFSDYSVYQLPFLAPAERRLALLAEQAGDADGALRHWARFAALWQDADADLQPWVAEARARLQPSTGTPMSPSR
jgi:tetratricopeptide (TPR) repeat protein